MKVQKIFFLSQNSNDALKKFCQAERYSQSEVMRGCLEKQLIDSGYLESFNEMSAPGRPRRNGNGE